MRWSDALTKIQNIIKTVLTFKQPFWCDSHPHLCVPCKRLRDYLRYGAAPNLIVIWTNKGLYWWSSLKGLKVKKIG